MSWDLPVAVDNGLLESGSITRGSMEFWGGLKREASSGSGLGTVNLVRS